MERAIKKYPQYKEHIERFHIEVERMYSLYADVSKEDKDANPSETLIKYAKSEKYREFYSKFPVVFNVLIISRIYSLKSFIKYLINYHSSRIDNKERFTEVCLTYLNNFEESILDKADMRKDIFVQFYMHQMETFFKTAEEVMDESVQEKVDEIRRKKNLELLKLKVSKVNF